MRKLGFARNTGRWPNQQQLLIVRVVDPASAPAQPPAHQLLSAMQPEMQDPPSISGTTPCRSDLILSL
jgi:hypothetical protein